MAKKLKNEQIPELRKPADVPNIIVAPDLPGRFSILSYRVQAAILIIIGFVFYFNTFSHEAAFDDRMAITENEYVQQGVAGIQDILSKDAYQSYLEHKNGGNQLAGGRYRPLSLITFAIEQQVMWVAPEKETPDAKEKRIAGEMGTRHVINVFLYVLSLLAVLYFLRMVVFPDNEIIAFLATLIFAIHPIHTEVVANVKSRDEILSVLFISLTFIKAYSYKETKKITDLVLAMLCFFLALLSKEYAVTLTLLLPLGFYLFKNEPLGFSFKTSLPYLVPFVLYVLLRFSAVSPAAEGAENNVMNNPYLFAGGAQKFATEIAVLLNYLKLLIFPDVLVADYSYNQVPYTTFSDPMVWLSLTVHIGLVVAMVILIKKRHVVGFAIAFYLVNLALVSNLFINVGAPMGERLVYHSSVGFAIAIAFLLYKGFGKMNIAAISKIGLAGFMILLVLVSGFKTIERNRDWKNDETLFLGDVNRSPNSALVNNNAAAACMSEAKKNKKDIPVRNEWFTKAIKYFDKAISVNPKYMLCYLNRGLSYYNMGNQERALADWDTVRKYEPGQANIDKYLTTVGKYFFSQGQKQKSSTNIDSTIFFFGKSAEATPKAPEPWYELGKAYYLQGDYHNAVNALRKTVEIAPNYQDAKALLDHIQSVNGMK